MEDKQFNEMFSTFKNGDLSASTKNLEEWLNHVDTPSELVQRYARKVEYELQRRQISESIKWQKWMTIVTGIMAVATIILAVITYMKS